MECLPESTLLDDFRGLGYDVTETDEGERVLASAIVEKFANGPDGALEPMTAGSTQPVASLPGETVRIRSSLITCLDA